MFYMIFIQSDLSEYGPFIYLTDNYEFLSEIAKAPVSEDDHYTLAVL